MKRKQLFTRDFILLAFSSLLFFSSFNMIIPDLPNYLTSLGGAQYKGYIISLFTLTAAISRPFSGKLSDQVGRIPIMIFGAGIAFLISISYPMLQFVSGFLFLRLIHGFSTGFKPTATSSYIADIVPDERRGEAMGIQGVATSLGMAVGPSVGSLITDNLGINNLFYISGVVALMSIVIIFNLKETLPKEKRKKLSLKMFAIRLEDFWEKRVLTPAVLFLFSTFSFGVLLTLIPDYSEYLQIGNKGIYFSVYVISSLSVRVFAGKLSDRHGRAKIINIGLLIQSLSMLAITFGQSHSTFYLSAVLFGLSSGMVSPSIFAWTVDLADPLKIGRAFASMYISLELGIGIGALSSGYIYSNKSENFYLAFGLSAFFAILAAAYGLFANNWKKPKKLSAQNT